MAGSGVPQEAGLQASACGVALVKSMATVAELEAWARKHPDMMDAFRDLILEGGRIEKTWNCWCLAAYLSHDNGFIRMDERYYYARQLETQADRLEESLRLLASKGWIDHDREREREWGCIVWKWAGVPIGERKQGKLDRLISGAVEFYEAGGWDWTEREE